MNRPLALIEGDVALPNARLLLSLPPPYGRAAASSDIDWNARMTQRRITDNPSPFVALSAPN
jgi:hypothetical protein